MRENFAIASIRDEIVARHSIVEWAKVHPWWATPETVKILFYADGAVRYDGGPFLGLKQVLATLTADHYHWVRFEITTAHRAADPSADHDNVDLAQALALDSFDQLWIYSALSSPTLTANELAAAKTFMDDNQGGVLITGDHANLGAAFGNLPRAGKMRLLPAPPIGPAVSNSTLRPGANATFEFDDQSDGTPQPLRLRRYWAGRGRSAPHPVLCSPLGPIDIFPDHEHEGEAVAPPATPASEWPGGVAAKVIAWGEIADTRSNTIGRDIGVLSAYEGHDQNVGRVLADSTWHHHFDVNLRGIPGDPARPGFVTPGTGDWITTARKIEHFFVNAAIWLAPPAKQSAMRAAALWAVLWTDHVIENVELATTPVVFGSKLVNALGRYAPHCVIYGWVWQLVPIDTRVKFLEYIEKGDPPPPLFEYVAGVAARQLIEELGVSIERFPDEAPPLEVIDKALTGAGEQAMTEMIGDMEAEVRSVRVLTVRDVGDLLVRRPE